MLDKSKENHILEIGCFEGLSSVFFADNFLNNAGPAGSAGSTLTCVDPFLNIDNNDHSYLLQNGAELNFDYNISQCKNTEKITVYKTTSDNFFKMNAKTFNVKTFNAKTFNFIYVDGCREPDFIRRDMDNSFNVLEKGGIMWMNGYDDGGYGYGSCDGTCDGSDDVIKKVMDDFLDKYAGQYVVIHKGYQLAIKKN